MLFQEVYFMDKEGWYYRHDKEMEKSIIKAISEGHIIIIDGEIKDNTLFVDKSIVSM